MTHETQDLKVLKTLKLFIGGEFPRTESGRSFPVYHYKKQKVYAHLCRASRKDFRNAVAAAQTALPAWSGKSAYNRSQVLYRMAEMMEGKREEFVETMIKTLGVNKSAARHSVDSAIDALVYFAGWADKYQQVIGSVNPVSGPHHNFTSAEPVGVVALLAGASLEFSGLAAQIAAIIASGNTVVILMTEAQGALLAPLAEVFATSDLTKGAVNLLTGYPDELYKSIGSHMEVQSLCAYGLDEKMTRELKELGADNMKRIYATSDTPSVKELLELESITNFVEYKTVWHPIGN